jgi:hypothetical protein
VFQKRKKNLDSTIAEFPVIAEPISAMPRDHGDPGDLK